MSVWLTAQQIISANRQSGTMQFVSAKVTTNVFPRHRLRITHSDGESCKKDRSGEEEE